MKQTLFSTITHHRPLAALIAILFLAGLFLWTPLGVSAQEQVINAEAQDLSGSVGAEAQVINAEAQDFGTTLGSSGGPFGEDSLADLDIKTKVMAAVVLDQMAKILIGITAALHWILRAAMLIFSVLLFVSLQPLEVFPVVFVGWNATREVVNLFFLLIWTVMAIGTILRLENWGARRILPSLITIAVLINFSYPVAGFLIDVTNVFGAQFLAAAGNVNSLDLTSFSAMWDWTNTFTENIMAGFNLKALYEPVTDENGVLSTLAGAFKGGGPFAWAAITGAEIGVKLSQAAFFEKALIVYISSFFGLIYAMGAIAIFALAGIMFLARAIYLWFLIILMPLAWAAYILPSTRNLWSQWWSKFNRWILFFPVFSFFIWLSVFLVSFAPNILGGSDAVLQMNNTIKANGIGDDSPYGVIPTLATPQLAVQYLVALAFLFASIVASNRMGIAGASVVQKAAVGVYTGTGRALRRAGGATARRAGQAAGAPELKRQAAESRLGRMITGLAPGAYTEQQAKERQKKAREKLGGMSEKDYVKKNWSSLVEYMQQRPLSSADVDTQASLFTTAINEGKAGDLAEAVGEKRFQALAQNAQSQGVSSKVFEKAQQQSNRAARYMGASDTDLERHNEAFFKGVQKDPSKLKQKAAVDIHDKITYRQFLTVAGDKGAMNVAAREKGFAQELASEFLSNDDSLIDFLKNTNDDAIATLMKNDTNLRNVVDERLRDIEKALPQRMEDIDPDLVNYVKNLAATAHPYEPSEEEVKEEVRKELKEEMKQKKSDTPPPSPPPSTPSKESGDTGGGGESESS